MSLKKYAPVIKRHFAVIEFERLSHLYAIQQVIDFVGAIRAFKRLAVRTARLT